MGVYNPMAKMPDNCAVCKEECGHRNITAHKRHKRCPLIEVKTPHGRLIDADALCERLMTEWHTADENGKKIISEVMADVVTPIVVGTPTVIEAEVE